MAEFRLGCYMYVLVLPYSDADTSGLDGFFDQAEFKEMFRHYESVSSWTHQDFSREEEITLRQTIRMIPRNPAELSE